MVLDAIISKLANKLGLNKTIVYLSQTAFGYISINSLTILMVSIAMGSSQKDLSIYASHVLR